VLAELEGSSLHFVKKFLLKKKYFAKSEQDGTVRMNSRRQ